MRTYVINLARSHDRRAHITAELAKAGLDYDIVTAVDGRELDLSDADMVAPSFADEIVCPAGSAGCALSHLRVYRKIISDGLDRALVLEDDAVLPAGIGRLADAIGERMSGAEAALLSYDSPEPCLMSREGVVSLSAGRVLALPLDVSQPRSTGAYVITREACERMLKNLPPVRVQADGWWFFYREGMLDRVRCVVPQPVLKDPRFGSTIGSYSLGNGFRARLVAPLLNRKIPLLQQALSRRRERIYREWGRSELIDAPFVEKPSRLG